MRLGKRNGVQKSGQNRPARTGKGASPQASHPAVAKLAAALREREQLREQQAATAKILNVIARSPSDVQPVFNTIARSAVRLCGALFSSVYRFDGRDLHFAAHHNFPRAALEMAKKTYPKAPDRSQGAGRAILTKAVVRIEDIFQDGDYRMAYGKRGGWRRVLSVPMMRSGTPVGTISVAWVEPGPVADEQVALLKTFADQAVIAIENTRRFNETKEALEHQKASGEILQVISSTPTDARPVFKSIVDSALRIFDGMGVHISLVRDGRLELMAEGGAVSGKTAADYPIAVDHASASGTAVLENRVVNIADTSSSDAPPHARRNIGGFRALACAPLLRQGKAVGVLSVSRRTPGALNAKQVALLQTFADQAVIAIENARLFNDTKEALEQQTATSEVLGVISRSPTDLQPVFDAILKSATELCEAHLGLLHLYDGERFRTVAHRGGNAEYEQFVFGRGSFVPESFLAELVAHLAPVHIGDIRDTPAYRAGKQNVVKMADMAGGRAFLALPLLKEGRLIGSISIYRPEVRPFSEKQISLVRTFADQAVIAIENARLFNETKEALEQQTATAEILRVISSSPNDMQPVFDSILENAMRLCDAGLGTVGLYDGNTYQHRAQRGGSPEYVKRLFDEPFVPGAQGTIGRMIAEARPVHVPDYRELPAYRAREPRAVATVELGGARTYLAVPLLKDGRVLGGITIRRAEVRPFTQKQIDLVSTFANQAVIAIENVRLFNETKEALEQQTATARILGVMSSSPGDVQPVLEAVAESAARLCESEDAVIRRVDADGLRRVAHFGPMPNSAATALHPLVAGSVGGRAVLERRAIHVEDIEEELRNGRYQEARVLQAESRYRTLLAMPLLREGAAIGVILIRRKEVRAFTEKHIVLLKTFADQAVIAIENVRLFNETKEALDRQTASSDVLSAISSSPSDVAPVFDTILRNATQLCGAHLALLSVAEGDKFRTVAQRGGAPEFVKWAFGRGAYEVPPMTTFSRAIAERRPVQAPDMKETPAFQAGVEAAVKFATLGGARTYLAVPLVKGDKVIGSISIYRPEVRPFSETQVQLVKSFADQAVIAIENVRLFNETKEALEQQTAISEILRVISSSPSDVQPVLDAVAERAARICAAPYSDIILVDGGGMRVAAGFGDIKRSAKGEILPLDRTTVMGRSIVDRKPVHIANLLEHGDEFPRGRDLAVEFGHRTLVAVPLLRENRALGTILVRRTEVRPFDDQHIALLKTFADQAAIAIENVRLFNETKQALERQTATAEILRVISQSPTDTQPVFEAIVASAVRLCAGSFGSMLRIDGETINLGAYCHPSPEAHKTVARRFPAPLSEHSLVALAARTGTVVHSPDTNVDPRASQHAVPKAIGVRAQLTVPLIRDGKVIGALNVARDTPGPFSETQIGMLKTFADQAVIAIENVRLFKELQAQTEALTKSVGQLTALGEVGQAISSTLDLETVLKTIVARAVQLTGLDGGSIYEYDEQAKEYRLRAAENLSAEIVDVLRSSPIRSNEGPVWEAGLTGQPTQILEMRDESYQTPRREFLLREGYRALLVVPLMRENRIVGALSVQRKAPGAFAPEVVELLKTFATQSALAIQNARLFREIAEKGRQLEVASQHKSQFLASMSHELRTPLNALLGFNEMILGDIYGEVPGDMRPPLAQMQSSGKHLLGLINNVLDLAKIESGRMELALAEYSVHDTVEGVRSTLQPLAAEKGLDFRAAVPAEIPLAYGDPGRITQCLMNLAGNSLKFTKAGKVEISVAVDDGLLRYRVADTGIGIPPDKIEGLFTEFKQSDATVASEYGGTGLGLSISKKFVEMHGGRIWAESEPGRGSVFTFEVPLRTKTP